MESKVERVKDQFVEGNGKEEQVTKKGGEEEERDQRQEQLIPQVHVKISPVASKCCYGFCAFLVYGSVFFFLYNSFINRKFYY